MGERADNRDPAGTDTSEWVPSAVLRRVVAMPPEANDDFNPPAPVEAPVPKPQPKRTPGGPTAGANGRIDLARASFDVLRELGLSVSQATRFISQRDQRGGLRSLSDLESFTGLPRDLKRELMARGRV